MVAPYYVIHILVFHLRPLFIYISKYTVIKEYLKFLSHAGKHLNTSTPQFERLVRGYNLFLRVGAMGN